METNKFFKYHSLGNDFIIFDFFNKEFDFNYLEKDVLNFKNLVINLCKRNEGYILL
jgi:diaminopimelate epimerase